MTILSGLLRFSEFIVFCDVHRAIILLILSEFIAFCDVHCCDNFADPVGSVDAAVCFKSYYSLCSCAGKVYITSGQQGTVRL